MSKHDWVGAGLFTFCCKCKVTLLSLGIPYKDNCKPTNNKAKKGIK